MAAVRNVLVVGGGMAGLSTAIGLGMRGVNVTVLEEAEEWTGASIAYYHRAVYALEELGILDEVMAVGNHTPAEAPSWWTGIYNPQGEKLGFRGPVLSEGWTLPSAVTCYRPILSRIMADAARKHGVELLVGHTYTDIEPHDDRVDVRLTTGEQRSFDLVVGADGIYSGIRERFFAEADEPHYIGQMAFRMMIEDAPESWWTGLTVSNGATISTNNLPGNDVPGNHCYVAVTYKMERRSVDQREAREIVQEVLAKFRPSPMFEQVSERLSQDDSVHIIVGPFEWIFIDPPWHRGRIVLAGDAVHATAPTIGSAGGMAIEDGVVLAQELTQNDDLEAALNGYVERRAERTKMVVEASEKLVRTHQEGWPPEKEQEIRLAALQKLIEPY